MFELLGVQQVFAETLAQIHIHFTESTFALDEVVKVLVHESSLLIFLTAHLLEICKEVGFLLGLVQEAELLVDERLHTDTADGFRLVKHLIVARSISFLGWA